MTDPGLQDVGSSAANPFTSFTTTPATSLVEYAGPLSYIVPTTVTAYVSKSGQLANFVCTATQTATAAITGTVSVNAGSAKLISSSAQTNWIGQQLQIAGDSSNGTYTIMSGAGRSWVISPVYGGASNAVAASATLSSVNPPVAGHGRRRRRRRSRSSSAAVVRGGRFRPGGQSVALCPRISRLRPGICYADPSSRSLSRTQARATRRRPQL